MSLHYPAKLLLFGEYSVLSGSQALAVPLHQWSGYWTNEDPNQSFSTFEFIIWLHTNSIIDDVNRKKMMEDAEQGWTFSSSIPIGHGVGSSGAYVAAVYERYLAEKYLHQSEDPSKIMASMEAFFHGSSSGMDPLVSLKKKAVLKDDLGAFHIIDDFGWPDGYKVYLWDSGISRTTGPLVSIYKDKMLDSDFQSAVRQTLIPMVDHAIHFYLNSTASMLEECISVISQFQKTFFTEMIPGEVMKIWNEVMAKNGVYMKLCGAGGGGFYMIISTQGEDITLPGILRID